MAKKNTRAEPTNDITQHTSTSEAITLRPRKRTIAKSQHTKIQKVEEKENALVILQPLSLIHLDELHKIWGADKRIPTVESRREWAAARNLAPQDVHRFFSRQKGLVKKKHRGLPKGTYTLPVGTPPVIKEKEEVPPPNQRCRKARRLTIKAEQSDDLPTSYTLVASSPPKKKCTAQTPRSSSPLPPSSPPAPSSPALDSDTYSTLVFSPPPPLRASTVESDTSSYLWRCPSLVEDFASSFTCALCTSGSTNT
ncbi:hypothetical protein DXG01_002120 [Tephrocybe rancida]|nr:hypothetical protein DXG01_002120 [Tephrocybe rancida]